MCTDRQTDRQTDRTTTVTLAAHARRGLTSAFMGMLPNLSLSPNLYRSQCLHKGDLLLQIREKQIKFFPLLQALSLESEEDESAQQLKELRTMVTSVFKRFKDEVSLTAERHCKTLPELLYRSSHYETLQSLH